MLSQTIASTWNCAKPLLRQVDLLHLFVSVLSGLVPPGHDTVSLCERKSSVRVSRPAAARSASLHTYSRPSAPTTLAQLDLVPIPPRNVIAFLFLSLLCCCCYPTFRRLSGERPIYFAISNHDPSTPHDSNSRPITIARPVCDLYPGTVCLGLPTSAGARHHITLTRKPIGCDVAPPCRSLNAQSRIK